MEVKVSIRAGLLLGDGTGSSSGLGGSGQGNSLAPPCVPPVFQGGKTKS